MNTHLKHTTTYADRVDVAGATGELRELLTVEAQEHIHQLRTLAPYVKPLAHTAQPPFFGFLTHDARQSLDRSVREDRLTARTNAQQGHPTPSASIPTPGNFTGIAADAEIAFLLQDAAKALFKAVRIDDVWAWVTPLPENPTLGDQINLVDDLLDVVVDATALKRTVVDLEQAVKVADELVDGPHQTGYADPCPHCGRRSLVVYFRDDLIRCEPKPAPSRCRCTTGNCPCHRDPNHRHEWHRVRSNGWYALKSAIDHRKNNQAATAAKENTTEKEPPTS